MLAVALAFAVALTGRMFAVNFRDAASPSQPGASRTSSNHAETARDRVAQTDRSASQLWNEQRPDTDQQVNTVQAKQAETQRREPAEAHAVRQATNQAGREALGAARESSSVDYSVVGLSFTVSESIFADCEKFRREACEPNKALLAEMAKEPREEPWATSAEERIRNFAEQEPGKFTIRALECRTSICFIETASIMGSFSYPLYYFEKNSALHAEYPAHSSETDELGAKVYVTLWAFTRR